MKRKKWMFILRVLMKNECMNKWINQTVADNSLNKYLRNKYIFLSFKKWFYKSKMKLSFKELLVGIVLIYFVNYIFFTVFISIGSITKGKVDLVGHETVTVVWTENGVISSNSVDKGTILHHFPRRCSWPSAKKSALFVIFFVFFVCFASATYLRYLQEIEVIFFLFDFSFNSIELSFKL